MDKFNSEKKSSPDNMASLIFPNTANDELFIPVHIFGGEPIAAICQLSSEVWGLKHLENKAFDRRVNNMCISVLSSLNSKQKEENTLANIIK